MKPLDVKKYIGAKKFEGIRIRSRNNILQEAPCNQFISAGQYLCLEADKGIIFKVGETQVNISASGFAVKRPGEAKPYFEKKQADPENNDFKGTSDIPAKTDNVALVKYSAKFLVEGVSMNVRTWDARDHHRYISTSCQIVTCTGTIKSMKQIARSQGVSRFDGLRSPGAPSTT